MSSLDTPAAVIVRRESDGAEWTGGGARIDQRFVPASSFKIPNTRIILGAGVIADPEKDVIPWDGVERGGSWDQDQTLRLAFRRSAYWAYSRLAREAGYEWVKSSVSSFGYGDENVGAPADTGSFWLEGARDTWFFAVNLDITDPELHRGLRRELAERALAAIGAFSP